MFAHALLFSFKVPVQTLPPPKPAFFFKCSKIYFSEKGEKVGFNM